MTVIELNKKYSKWNEQNCFCSIHSLTICFVWSSYISNSNRISLTQEIQIHLYLFSLFRSVGVRESECYSQLVKIRREGLESAIPKNIKRFDVPGYTTHWLFNRKLFQSAKCLNTKTQKEKKIQHFESANRKLVYCVLN